jgi:hypothetical protein
MRTIEGQRFSALTNLASDFRTFLRILIEQPEVRALSSATQSDQVTIAVFERLLTLAGSPTEAGYEHPADAAMAAYLWLLSTKDRDYSEIAAETVLGCGQCWWSRKMAEQVRKVSRFRSGAGMARAVLPIGEVGVDYSAHIRGTSFAVPVIVQVLARATRAAPEGRPQEIAVYPLEREERADLFKNHETRNRDREVLAGR